MSEVEPRADTGATPIERIARPFQVFARFKSAGAIVLLAASVGSLLLWRALRV